MSDPRKSLGATGERLAATFLQQKGLIILARNWRCPLGEIDIVAKDGEIIVVVEVKTRRGRGGGTPEQGVTPAKQGKLCELAQTYCDLTGWEGLVRIDVVGIELDRVGHLLRISHWPEAVLCW